VAPQTVTAWRPAVIKASNRRSSWDPDIPGRDRPTFAAHASSATTGHPPGGDARRDTTELQGG
jgi:hypothetical protein